MKRVTILLDDEELYRSVKAQAAREGRPVKEAVQEAFRSWLGTRGRLSDSQARQMRTALDALDAIRRKQRKLPAGSVSDLIWESREERLESISSVSKPEERPKKHGAGSPTR